jgi:DNA-binding CsgD family transcriptional regulator
LKTTRTGSSSALTPRQEEILELVTRGISNKAIAAQLGISVDTVRRHGARIKQKKGGLNHIFHRLPASLGSTR